MFLNLNIHHDERTLELELILAVCALALIALIFLMLTFLKRTKKIKKVRKGKKYQSIIDEMTYKIMFDESAKDEVCETYKGYQDKKLFNKILVKALVSLHRSYVGEPKTNIEKFYEASGLCNFSLKKLKSKSWVNNVEAIRDLSKLNYKKAYSKILELTQHKRIEVQKEAIIGIVLLNGINELEKFKDSELYFDDWMQTNFLYSLKIKQNTIENINLDLFQSKNESFLLLLARIVELYRIHIHYNTLVETLETIKKEKTRTDFETIIARLN